MACMEKTTFRVGNALRLPHETSSFDGLIDRGLFHHILPENRPRYMWQILRVLKPGASMYLSVFSMRNHKDIGQRFTRASVGDIFGYYFSTEYADEDPYPTQSPAHLLHFILKHRIGSN